jgi:quercetin dioxygenase-like cupin family protein
MMLQRNQELAKGKIAQEVADEKHHRNADAAETAFLKWKSQLSEDRGARFAEMEDC